MTHQSGYVLEWEILQQPENLGYECMNIYNIVSDDFNKCLKELGVLKHD